MLDGARKHPKARASGRLGAGLKETLEPEADAQVRPIGGDVIAQAAREGSVKTPERPRTIAKRPLTRNDHRRGLPNHPRVGAHHERGTARGVERVEVERGVQGAFDRAEVAHAQVDQHDGRGHSVPFVEGRAVPSMRTASRRARARALKLHSMM